MQLSWLCENCNAGVDRRTKSILLVGKKAVPESLVSLEGKAGGPGFHFKAASVGVGYHLFLFSILFVEIL